MRNLLFRRYLNILIKLIMTITRYIFTTLFILFATLTTVNSQNQSTSNPATPEIGKDFDAWANWIGNTKEYDPAFRNFLNANCCSELTLFTTEYLDPALNYLLNEPIDVDIRVKEMGNYIDRLESAYNDKNLERMALLFKTSLTAVTSVMKLSKLNVPENELQDALFDVMEDQLKDLVTPTIESAINLNPIERDNLNTRLDQQIGILEGSIAAIKSTGNAAADVQKITDRVKNNHGDIVEQTSKMGEYMFIAGVVTNVFFPPGALVLYALSTTMEVASGALATSISDQQYREIGKFIQKKETVLTGYRKMLNNLLIQQETLTRQRRAIENKCKNTKKNLRDAAIQSRSHSMNADLSTTLNQSKSKQQSNSLENKKITLTLDLPPLEEAITVYPNPASKELFITLNGLGAYSKEIHLYSAFGQQIYAKQVAANTQSVQKIDIRNLENGTYWLSVYLPQKQLRMTKQVLVTK